MTKISRLIPTLIVVAGLVGCAAEPVILAGAAGDSDAKAFDPPPGLARLYLVHGISLQERDPYANIPWRGMTASEKRLEEIFYRPGLVVRSQGRYLDPAEYRLNGQALGSLQAETYMALDLLPGTYAVSFLGPHWSGPNEAGRSVTLTAGDVVMLRSQQVSRMSGLAFAFSLEDCSTNSCGPLIRLGRRAVAAWPPPAQVAEAP